MNAAGKIQAAIEKLEGLRTEGTDGPWSAWHPQDNRSNSCVDGAALDPDNPPLAVEGGRKDVALIVTLHRTIDAQLAILRSALTYTVGELTFTLTNPQQYSPEAVALAESILA